MAQTKKNAKTAKRKKIVSKKPKSQKKKASMGKMSRKENEKMVHSEPVMFASDRKTAFQSRKPQPRMQQNNPGPQWRQDISQPETRRGNTQQQWTERVAEGQRNTEPAPSVDEFEPEKS